MNEFEKNESELGITETPEQETDVPENTEPAIEAAQTAENSAPKEETIDQAPPVSSYQETVKEDPQPVYVPSGEYRAKAAKKSRSKKKINNSALAMALTVLLSTGFGFGGGYLASKAFGSSTVIYKTSEVTGTSVSTTGNATSGELTIAQIAEKAAPSVVEINVTVVTTSGYGFFQQEVTGTAAGSGVIISSDGYIITNNHVVEGAQSITVRTYDGTEYEAELIGTDSKSDIAVIKVEAEGLTAATIGDSSKIKAGDTAVVIGNPLGTLGGTVTNGIISATDREVTINNESMDLIQTNAAINSGNSGGGLFDGNGNLIGIVNAKDSGTTSNGTVIEGLGFAIPVNTAMDVAQQLITSGKVTNRATIGVYLQTLSQDTQQYKAGVYISDVMEGSGAQAAGLQPYDRIISVDGTAISSYTELSALLKDKKIGDTISMTIEREGQELTVDVTLTGAIE